MRVRCAFPSDGTLESESTVELARYAVDLAHELAPSGGELTRLDLDAMFYRSTSAAPGQSAELQVESDVVGLDDAALTSIAQRVAGEWQARADWPAWELSVSARRLPGPTTDAPDPGIAPAPEPQVDGSPEPPRGASRRGLLLLGLGLLALLALVSFGVVRGVQTAAPAPAIRVTASQPTGTLQRPTSPPESSQGLVSAPAATLEPAATMVPTSAVVQTPEPALTMGPTSAVVQTPEPAATAVPTIAAPQAPAAAAPSPAAPAPTVLATGSPSPGRVLLSFAVGQPDAAAGWPNNQDSTAWLAADGYHLFARQAQQFVGVSVVPDQLGDVQVLAAFHKVGGAPGGGYGIIVRDQGPLLRNGLNQGGRFYVVEVGDRGEVGMWRREQDQWVDILPWSASSAVHTDTAENQIVVKAVGGQLALSVNGIDVSTRTDNTLSSGTVGVFAGGDQNHAVLTRLAVQALN